MPGDPHSIGYTVFVDSRSGSWRLFGSLKDIQLRTWSGRCLVFDCLWWMLLGECVEKIAWRVWV